MSACLERGEPCSYGRSRGAINAPRGRPSRLEILDVQNADANDVAPFVAQLELDRVGRAGMRHDKGLVDGAVGPAIGPSTGAGPALAPDDETKGGPQRGHNTRQADDAQRCGAHDRAPFEGQVLELEADDLAVWHRDGVGEQLRHDRPNRDQPRNVDARRPPTSPGTLAPHLDRHVQLDLGRLREGKQGKALRRNRRHDKPARDEDPRDDNTRRAHETAPHVDLDVGLLAGKLDVDLDLGQAPRPLTRSADGAPSAEHGRSYPKVKGRDPELETRGAANTKQSGRRDGQHLSRDLGLEKARPVGGEKAIEPLAGLRARYGHRGGLGEPGVNARPCAPHAGAAASLNDAGQCDGEGGEDRGGSNGRDDDDDEAAAADVPGGTGSEGGRERVGRRGARGLGGGGGGGRGRTRDGLAAPSLTSRHQQPSQPPSAPH